MFQGDECSRGMSVLGDGCLGGWEFHNSSGLLKTLFLLEIAKLMNGVKS